MSTPVTQDVIFKIGSVGVTSSVGGIAKLTAGFIALRAAVNYVQQDLLPLSRAYSNMSDEQRYAADALGKATGGLLDSLDQIRAAQKLSVAGLPNYKETLAAIGKISVDMSEKLGESGEDAAARMNTLIDGVVKGSPRAVRALREYGIEVKTGSKNTEEFRKVVTEALIYKAKDIEINVDNVDKAIRSFSNALDDAPAAMLALVNNTDSFNAALGSASATLDEFKNALLDAPQVGASFSGFLESTAEDIWNGLLPALTVAAGAIDALTGGNAKGALKGITKNIEGGFQSSRDYQYGTVAAAAMRQKASEPGNKRAGRGAGGGKGKVTESEMEFTVEETEFGIFEPFLRDAMDWRKAPGMGEEFEAMGGALDAEAIKAASDAQLMFNDAYAEHLEMLRQKLELSQFDPDALTLEEKQELWDAEIDHEEKVRIYEEQRLEYIRAKTEREIGFAEEFKLAWESAFAGMTSGGIAANTAMGLLNSSVAATVKAAVMGEKSFGRMIAAMVRDAAIGGASQAIVLGLLEMVKAATYYAMPFGSGSAQGAVHTAAGVEAFATAAVMFGIAAAGHAASGGYNKGKGTSASGASMAAGTGATRSAEPESISITNTLIVDGNTLYNAVETRAVERAQQGRRGLAVAA